MDVEGPALAFYADTEDDADCFGHCLYYSGSGNSPVTCGTTVRRVNGDCYLRTQTIDEAVPTTAQTYVTYCVEGALPHARVYMDCGRTPGARSSPVPWSCLCLPAAEARCSCATARFRGLSCA